MQSDPTDEQGTNPESRDGEPVNPEGVRPGEPGGPPVDQPASPQMPVPPPVSTGPAPPPPDGTPPQVPAPPQMPAPPRMPAPTSSAGRWAAPPPAVPDGSSEAGASELPHPSEPGPSVDPAGSGVEQSDGAVADRGVDPADAEPSRPDASEAVPGPGQSDERPTDVDTRPAPMVGPVVQGDWLASVCPYLASEDGTYRSAAPEEGHRCVAVEPSATLPLAFQERFCLTDRHPRCEMYKFARETGEESGIPIPAATLTMAATRPARSSSGSGGSNRSVLIGVVGVGGAAILVLLLVLMLGSCSGGSGDTTDDLVSPDPQSTQEPGSTPTPKPEPTPTPEPTPEPEPTPTPDPDATPDEGTAAQGDGFDILYEVQEGEALLKVAETFGITRKKILRANPELADVAPADMPGTVIVVPVPATMTIEEVEVVPGFQGLAPPG